MSVVFVPLLAQEHSAPQNSPHLSGVVTDREGQPIVGAIVKLQQVERDVCTQVTDRNGHFDFGVVQPEASRLNVEAAGRQAVLRVLEAQSTAESSVRIILLPSKAGAEGSALQPTTQILEYSDTADFKVAGITDWTAVGGHGSDATLRTSEDLARHTSVLNEPANKGGLNQAALHQQRENELRAELAITPASYALNHELGQLYLDTRRYSDAVPLLEMASTLHGHGAYDEYAVAQACAGLGDLNQAQRHLTLAMRKGDKAEFRRLAGDVDEKLGDPLGAVREEERAVQLDPSEDNYLAWASELLLHRAIWQAADVLAQGSRRFPRSSRIFAAWGAALFAGAKYDEAAQRFCKASDLEPTSREPYLLLGKAVLGSPALLSCATETLARFVRLRPEDAEANYYDAMQLLKTHNDTESQLPESLLHRAAELNPQYAEAYLQLGILASAHHQDDDALRYLQQAVAADPEQAEAHYRLGVLYDRSGRAAEAQREFHTHEVVAKHQAEATESERRRVKQFLVVPQDEATAKRTP